MEKVVFFFYFKDHADCRNCAYLLEKKGLKIFDISFDEERGEDCWSILISKIIKCDNELELLCERFAYYAKEFNGRFDGYERRLD